MKAEFSRRERRDEKLGQDLQDEQDLPEGISSILSSCRNLCALCVSARKKSVLDFTNA